MNEAMIQKAKKLAAAGFVPLPLHGKAPVLEGWSDIPTVDITTVDQWVKDGKLANLGLRTGDRGLVVLDFDGTGGYDAFVKAFGDQADTYTVATGSGNGMHVYYRVKGDLPRSTGQLEVPGGHIEIKAKGRQVVVPPSVHPDTGALYTVANNHPTKELDSFEPIQAWINGFNAAKYQPRPHEADTRDGVNGSKTNYAKTALSNLVGELNSMNNVEDDYQNNTLNLVAWKLAHFVSRGDLSRTEVFNACEAAMASNGYIGRFGRSAFEKTFESGFSRGMSDSAYVPKVYQNGNTAPRREMPGERAYTPPPVEQKEDVTTIGRTRIVARKALFNDLHRRIFDDDYVPASPPVIFPLRCLHGLGGQARVTASGKIIMLVGASGSGKTSALETIADAYVADGVPVWMWTPEWTPDEMAERVVQRYGGVTQDALYLHEIDKWRSKVLGTPESGARLDSAIRQKSAEAMRVVRGWAHDVSFVENSLMTIAELSEVMGAAQGICTPFPRVLIVDYAQLLKANEVDERDELSMYTMIQRFKALCTYLGLIGILATQTTKDEARQVSRGKPLNTTVLNCTKNSRGRTGKIRVRTDMEHLRILDEDYPNQLFRSDAHYLGSQAGRFINDDAANLFITLNPEMEDED